MRKACDAILPIFMVAILVACGSEATGPPQGSLTAEPPIQAAEPTETPVVPSPTPTGVSAQPSPTRASSPTATPSPTATASADTDAPASPLAGIIYETADGLWQIDAAGEPVLLSEQPGVQLSPDGTHGLYIEDGDVWVLDLSSGEELNVTAGSNREHVHAQWWPERPETLVLGSWGEGEAGPNTGKLTLVEVDGRNYRVANENGALSYALPAPAPDGETIAFDEAGSAMLYDINSGVTPFDPLSFNLAQGVEVQRIASPAWSPDGGKLAWPMAVTGGGYGSSGSWDIVVGVFNLEAQTAQLLHPFQPVGRGGWFAPPAWSPDGRWLAFNVESTEAAEQGLWALAADGSAEQQLVQSSNLVAAWWSPPGDAPWQNGRTLLVGVAQPDSEFAYSLVEASTWQATPVALPPQAMVHDWRRLP